MVLKISLIFIALLAVVAIMIKLSWQLGEQSAENLVRITTLELEKSRIDSIAVKDVINNLQTKGFHVIPYDPASPIDNPKDKRLRSKEFPANLGHIIVKVKITVSEKGTIDTFTISKTYSQL